MASDKSSIEAEVSKRTPDRSRSYGGSPRRGENVVGFDPQALTAMLKRLEEKQEMSLDRRMGSIQKQLEAHSLKVNESLEKVLSRNRVEEVLGAGRVEEKAPYRSALAKDRERQTVGIEAVNCLMEEESKKGGEVLNALRVSSLITSFKPTATNINSWMSSYWDRLDELFPNLTEAEKISIMAGKLPSDTIETIHHLGGPKKTKSAFFNQVRSIMLSTDSDLESSRINFYALTPNRSDKFGQFVNTVQNLSHCLAMDRQEREYAVVRKIVSTLPPLVKSLVNMKVEFTRNSGKEIEAFNILSEIMRDSAQLREIEMYWRKAGNTENKVSAHTFSVMQETNEDEKRKGEKTPGSCSSCKDSKECKTDPLIRCSRCNSCRHESRRCGIYKNPTIPATPCTQCLNHFQIANYHTTKECIHRFL